jgi:predicted secreted protein
MSIFGIFITYACSWWLVLFMVLPWKVKMAENPVPGPAASAPVNPMLPRKFLITTLIAIIPTVIMYFIVGHAARAAEPDMYHAGSTPDCGDGVAYEAPADISATDSDATIADPNRQIGTGDVHVGIDLPLRDYTKAGNGKLDHSDVYAGDVAVSPDGTLKYNGKAITQRNPDAGKCK